jgi:hypothetical protein
VVADATSGFDSVIIDGTGVTLTYTNTAGEFAVGTGAITSKGAIVTGHAYGQKNGIASPQLGFDVLYKSWVPGTADESVIAWQNNVGTQLGKLNRNSANKLRLLDAASGIKYTAAAIVPDETWLRIKTWIKPGTDTVTGSFSLRIWNFQTDTLLDSYDTTVSNFGITNVDRLRLGHIGNAAGQLAYDMAGYDPSATGLLADLDTVTPVPAGWTEYRLFKA